MLPIDSLIHRYGITYNIASEQGTDFAGTWGGGGGRVDLCLVIHWLYHRLHHPEVTGLLECWSGLQKAQMKLQLRGNTLQGWAAVFQDAV